MSVWLEKFEARYRKPIKHEPICTNSAICTEGQNHKKEQPICANCTNCTGVSDKKSELLALNQRWQKALKLDQSGFFEGKSPEYQEKVCQELRQICARAGELWEVITEVCPHQEEELNALELFDF